VSKKDYVAIAKAIRDSRAQDHDGEFLAGWIHGERLVNLLTEYMARDNRHFDVRRFEAAALGEEG